MPHDARSQGQHRGSRLDRLHALTSAFSDSGYCSGVMTDFHEAADHAPRPA
jgi:hypothetical protein